jgi:hypothetical protein
MPTMQKSIDVEMPVRTAYNQWTQFEQFPQFMEGVREVRQLDDRRLHWRAEVAGKEKAWDAEIVEQAPDRRVAWRSTSGAENAGAVDFEPLDADHTRVTLQLSYDPEGVVENVGDALGFVSRRVEGDLRRFKQFIETRGAETGAWRGEIHAGHAESGRTRAVGEADAAGRSGREGAAGMRAADAAGFVAMGTASETDRGHLGGPPFHGDTPGGMGSGMEGMLGGGPDSMYGRGVDDAIPGDNDTDTASTRSTATGGAAGIPGTMTGSSNQGRADTGQADTSYPSVAGPGTGNRSLEHEGGAGGTTGPSATGDAGGGSDTTGGLTYGVAGMYLPEDKQNEPELRGERQDTAGGKASVRDSNIKTD